MWWYLVKLIPVATDCLIYDFTSCFSHVELSNQTLFDIYAHIVYNDRFVADKDKSVVDTKVVIIFFLRHWMICNIYLLERIIFLLHHQEPFCLYNKPNIQPRLTLFLSNVWKFSWWFPTHAISLQMCWCWTHSCLWFVPIEEMPNNNWYHKSMPPRGLYHDNGKWGNLFLVEWYIAFVITTYCAKSYLTSSFMFGSYLANWWNDISLALNWWWGNLFSGFFNRLCKNASLPNVGNPLYAINTSRPLRSKLLFFEEE